MLPHQQADELIFKEYYQEELQRNPLYEHLLYALQHRSQWPDEAWLAAAHDFRDYEYACFKTALYRMRQINGTAAGQVRDNEFILFQSALPVVPN